MTRTNQLLLLLSAAAVISGGGCAGMCQCPWEPANGVASAVTDQPAVARNSPSQSATTKTAQLPAAAPIIRGQSPGYGGDSTFGGYSRAPQPVSGVAPQPPNAQGAYGVPPPPYAPAPAQPQYGPPQQNNAAQSAVPQQQYGAAPFVQSAPNYVYQPQVGPGPASGLPSPPSDAMNGIDGSISPVVPGFPGMQPQPAIPQQPLATPTPLDVFVEETRTGQFMFGVTVNSNAGLVGNIVISERNFDIMNPPTSWDDFAVGRAWRGAGQGFRIEAQPGTVLQRYLVSFTEPYFLGTNISFDSSGYYFNRVYFDWTEARVGGRLAWGYRLTPDLALSTALRLEDVNVYNPRKLGVPELDRVLGHNDLYSGRVTLTHDTRDIPFSPTQGHLITASFEQAFGEFSFPRGDFEMSQYFLVRQRPDGSGRHTAGFITKLGVTGSDTPIFENYFAGGFSTIRGFQFRGASPKNDGVTVGGQFQWLNSAEYYFPLTADDMIRATIFCDFGTVETSVALHSDQFRVAPGFGFRINVPAMGPAPLAFDFAFPVAQADTDHKQMFSFFFGATR